MSWLGERTITLDCDVLQADGGTRTAAITGAYVALVDSVVHIEKELVDQGLLMRRPQLPLDDFVGAISVGIVDGQPVLDLNYEEDVAADVDMNVVMTGRGRIIEVQGTAEGAAFDRKALDELLDLAEAGIRRIVEVQKAALGTDIAGRIGGAEKK